MVLFKRKPVQILPPANIEDDDQEVWHIPQTGEIFASYEDFLTRMDFYKQPRFNDEITGHSGLTYFEANKRELAAGRQVEEAFPEALKGPILRKVQFQIVSRLDSLVDSLFDEFKIDYYPGEDVTVTLDDSEKFQGLVRDKTAFGPRVLPDGSKTLPTTRYLVVVPDTEEEVAVTQDQIFRDRGIFTKAMLRSFLKRTVIREAWNGAPWLVKHEYAAQYHIDTRIPPHLRYDTKLLERKQLQARKRSSSTHRVNGHDPNSSSEPVRLPELKPTPKSHKHKQHGSGKSLKWTSMPMHGTHHTGYPSPGHFDQSATPREPTPPPPPPPPKYPIEDLQLDPSTDKVRPTLKYLCNNPPDVGDDTIDVDDTSDVVRQRILMESVGPLLETWDTLNVYCEIFKLDSFTFDDFVEAMAVASERTHVQLFEEIHCAVLKVMVDSEADGGKIRINMPELDEQDDDEENESDEDAEDEMQESQLPTPDPEPKPSGRATRSSLAKQEAERLAAEAAAAEEETLRAELATHHRAEEALKLFDWVEHLRKRDFANGGWEVMVVGLLYHLSKRERRQEKCEALLLQLVPPGDAEPTPEFVRQRYAELDVDARAQALQMLCMLTMDTKAVRGYMEDCSETMTKYRKDKVEWQRQRKQALEELKPLNDERKILLPDNMPASPPPESVKAEDDGDVKMNGADDSTIELEDQANGTDDDGSSRRNRRRSQMDKQRKKEEEEKKKEKLKAQEKAAAAAKAPTQTKQFIKLLKQIQKKEEVVKECEDEIAIIENDLREADCPRTRVLGRDRFWNRYYWFERNGMPYAGLPDSSTASAGYANGCIWVQGPDELEREGYIDMPQEHQDEYIAKFNMSVPERKVMEEGRTRVYNAHQWGYISEPDQVDELIKWLDPRGFNELKLRKEIVTFRDKIVAHMEARQKFLAATEDKDKKDESSKRTSSRIRDKTPEPPSYRCLKWENTMALEDLGHLHIDQPPPPRTKKPSKKREAMAEATAAAERPAKSRRR